MAKVKNAVFSLPEHYFSRGTTNASSLLPFLFALFFVVLLVISLSYDKVDYLLLPAATLFDVHQPAVSAPVLLAAETTTTSVDDDDQYCDLFSGRWVLDNVTRPLYSGRRCTYMHDEVACEKYGRTDLKHQLWRWQPHACNIPRFDAERMLRKLSGKRMVYVGDSLNRNQWVSMVCMLESTLNIDTKSMTFDGSLMSFKAKEFNASIDFYWSPLLVESNCDDPVHHRLSDRIMRANSIQTHAKQWADADILIFNSYLWWKKPGMKMKVLYGSFEDEKFFQNLEEFEMVEGFEMALKEWSNWLESNRNLNAQVFFVSLSPTHVWGDEWGAASSQNCYNETEPIHEQGYASRGSDYKMMHIVEDTVAQLSQKGVHVQILNITQLSEYRKDGHPSIYRRYWVNLTDQELAKPSSYADCTHWCVPGVPDAWNELLYTYIISQQN